MRPCRLVEHILATNKKYLKHAFVVYQYHGMVRKYLLRWDGEQQKIKSSSCSNYSQVFGPLPPLNLLKGTKN